MAKKKQKEISEQESEAAALKLPPGVKLVRSLRGHSRPIGRIAWSPSGRFLASPSDDGTARLWDLDEDSSHVLFTQSGGLYCTAWSPDGSILASVGTDYIVRLWNGMRLVSEIKTGQRKRRGVYALAWSPNSQVIAASAEDLVFIDPIRNRVLRALSLERGNTLMDLIWLDDNTLIGANSGGQVTLVVGCQSPKPEITNFGDDSQLNSVVSLNDQRRFLTASCAKVIRVWDRKTRKVLNELEGHTNWVTSITLSSDGGVIASKSTDNSIRLWETETWNCLAHFREDSSNSYQTSVAFHPTKSLLATVGSDPNTAQANRDCLIHIWELDFSILRRETSQTSHYVNAKVVLLGDTGVGKSGLSLVLNGKRYKKTDSTPGRKVWTFSSQEVALEKNLKQTRETLLWDLAGQPGYRVIHQLHLNEVAVALVVFDARSETDPLAGVRHWERALRLAQQRQGSTVPMKKLLVSARNDRGTVSVSKERLDALLKEFEFDGYFETSAKEGWQIKELRRAIEQGIPWDDLPEVSSSVLFASIKAFLLKAKTTGRLVAPAGQLYDDFARTQRKAVKTEPNLSQQFETCIGRLENRDLIRRLSFGGYVLLQPELLDAYASAMVNAAKEEPDGLGSITEEAALAGQFYVPKEQKILDRGQEQLLLHATVEELARYDLALRESAADGRYLVFPSQFNRDYEAAPEPKGKALAITFDGPVQSLYSTLAVRLGHSGLFTTGRAEMWRNAAVFAAKAGGKCGLYLHEFEEARGRLVIFYDQHEGQQPSDETRFHFEEFVLAHAQRHALTQTVELIRFFVCAKCGNPVPDNYVKMLRDQGQKTFDCPCRTKVSLEEPKERLRFASQVATMERSADRQRDFEMFVESARGETSTPGFTEWAGDDRVTLAIVFTDVVGSTALGEELKDAGMNELRRTHFAHGRKLIAHHKGREIKTIGDSFMAAFRSVGKALDYAMALQTDPGHPKVKIRAGIHIGSMTVEEDDVFGGTVNRAARVVSAIKEPEIWLSDEAKSDLDSASAKQHTRLKWKRQDGVEMKGFNGTFTLWSLQQ